MKAPLCSIVKRWWYIKNHLGFYWQVSSSNKSRLFSWQNQSIYPPTLISEISQPSLFQSNCSKVNQHDLQLTLKISWSFLLPDFFSNLSPFWLSFNHYNPCTTFFFFFIFDKQCLYNILSIQNCEPMKLFWFQSCHPKLKVSLYFSSHQFHVIWASFFPFPSTHFPPIVSCLFLIIFVTFDLEILWLGAFFKCFATCLKGMACFYFDSQNKSIAQNGAIAENDY